LVPLTNIILTRKFKKKKILPSTTNIKPKKKNLEKVFEFLKKIDEEKSASLIQQQHQKKK